MPKACGRLAEKLWAAGGQIRTLTTPRRSHQHGLWVKPQFMHALYPPTATITPQPFRASRICFMEYIHTIHRPYYKDNLLLINNIGVEL